MTPEKLDELYALAKKEKMHRAISGGLISKEYRQATYPDAVMTLIDRVRELESLLGEARDTIEDMLGYIVSTGDDDAVLDKIRAALNKEQK